MNTNSQMRAHAVFNAFPRAASSSHSNAFPRSVSSSHGQAVSDSTLPNSSVPNGLREARPETSEEEFERFVQASAHCNKPNKTLMEYIVENPINPEPLSFPYSNGRSPSQFMSIDRTNADEDSMMMDWSRDA